MLLVPSMYDFDAWSLFFYQTRQGFLDWSNYETLVSSLKEIGLMGLH